MLIIAMREVREQVRGWGFRVYVIGLLVLLGFNYLVFLRSFPRSWDEYQFELSASMPVIDLYKTTVSSPPNPTQFLSSAGQHLLPSNVTVQPFHAEDLGGKREPSTFIPDAMPIDWLSIIGIWGSLAAIVFSFDAVSRERQRKTLGMIFSFGISRSRFGLGKLIGLWLLAIVPLTLLGIVEVVLVLLTLTLHAIAIPFLSIIGSCLAVMLTGWIYLLAFVLLGQCASLVWRDPGAALFNAVLVWVFMIWIWPTASLKLAVGLRPLESHKTASEAWHQKQQRSGVSVSSDLIKPIVDAPLPDVKKEERISQLAKLIEMETESERIAIEKDVRQMKEDYARRRFEQTTFGLTLSSLSPFGSWQLASNSLCVAGYSRYAELLRQARGYAREYGAASEEIRKRHDSLAEFDSRGSAMYGGFEIVVRGGKHFRNLRRELIGLPSFVWDRPSLWSRVGEALPAIAVILLWNLVLFSFASVRMERADAT